MGAYCTFTGSYYDPAPWTNEACPVDAAVPEGCPIHFVTGAPIDPAHITAERVSNQLVMPTASTATIIGSDEVTFSVMDVMSCDCAQTNVHVSFSHVSVDVPDAVAGESVRLQGVAYSAPDYEVAITAPGPCPTPDWPSGYQAGLACDLCPIDPDGDPNTPNGSEGGCSAGGEPSLLLFAAAALFVRRRRRASAA